MLAGILSLALVVTLAGVWSVRRAFPQHDGTLALPGLSADVTVYRDDAGVARIYATDELDLFRAQGYVHAQDRFWEMDLRRHLTAGRLSELFGAAFVDQDALLRTLGWHDVAAREWDLLSTESQSRLQAYADGVNAWIDENGGARASGDKGVQYTLLALQNRGLTVRPWEPVDSLAWLKALAWDLRGNMDLEIERAQLLAAGLTRTQVEQLYPPYPYDLDPVVVDDPDPDAGPAPADGVAAASRAPAASTGPRGAGLPPGSATALARAGVALAAMGEVLGEATEGIGSNAWVVSGDHTASGLPLLASDPHLGASAPGVWYQVGLHCECGLDVVGFSFAGLPGVVMGHNDRIAWGLTNLAPDTSDLYVERVHGDRYHDGTGWRDMAVRTEVLQVAGGDPVTIDVRSTRAGPLVSDRAPELLGVAERPPVDRRGEPVRVMPAGPVTADLDTAAPGVPEQAAAADYGVALRWTALDPGRTMEAIFAVGRARNWQEFRAAAAMFDAPSQNMLYADVDGNIGYQAPGAIPVRGAGDGRWPVPGWDPAYAWTGTIPFEELPVSFDPEDGVIVSANQAVVGPDYPHLLTADWADGSRSTRIGRLLAERADRGLTVADMRAIQFDDFDGFAAGLVPYLLAAAEGDRSDGGSDRTLAGARELLEAWDHRAPADEPAGSSAAAAYYYATLRHLLHILLDELPDEPDTWRPTSVTGSHQLLRGLLAEPDSPWWDIESTEAVETRDDVLVLALSEAAAELSGRLGDDPTSWRWGRLHTVTLVSPALGESGIAPLDAMLNRGPVPVSGGSGTVNATSWSTARAYEAFSVPTMRMIVDLSELGGSRWVQLTGNSGHPFHPDYDDQIDSWRTGKDRPMPWGRDEVEASAQRVLVLTAARVSERRRRGLP